MHMLHEYARLILSLNDTQFILLTVGAVSFIGILIAYLCARKYFAKNFDKPYSIRVVPSAFIFALYSFLLTLVPVYISGSIYDAFHDDGGSMLIFFMVFWSIPASVVIFIIGLFIFGLKKIDPVKLVPLQYLNKTEKGVVWFYILILATLVFVTYLTKAYVPFYEISNIDTQIKESNTQEREIEEMLKTESEFIKNEPKIKEYAMQNAQDNVFLCIKFFGPDMFVVSENYLIENNYLYQRVHSDQYHIPANHVAIVENNKIIFNENSGIDLSSLQSCYNMMGERMGEKYEIIIQ